MATRYLVVRLPASALKGLNPAVVVAAGVVAYHQTKVQELKPYDDVIFALRRLSKTDLKLGIITGGLAVKQAEKVIRQRLGERREVYIAQRADMALEMEAFQAEIAELNRIARIRADDEEAIQIIIGLIA